MSSLTRFPNQNTYKDKSHLKNKSVWIHNAQNTPEGIILSEMGQTEKQILYDFTYVWNLKNQNS